jgi:hypothetical protein
MELENHMNDLVLKPTPVTRKRSSRMSGCTMRSMK